MNSSNIPLFRTRAIVPTATAAPQTATLAAPQATAFLPENCVTVGEVGDITFWIGRNVSRRLWQEITQRAKVLGWTIEATEIGELMHVTRLTAGRI